MMKYVCVGGSITSLHDGQTHYISPDRLPHLYVVNRKDCVFADNDAHLSLMARGRVKLRPRPGGDYSLDKITLDEMQ